MSNPYIRVTLACLICFTFTPRSVHGEPVTNVYEIVSGEAGWCCGIAGEFRTTLPSDSESHVWLITDSAQQSAQMILLGYLDAEPISAIFNNGRIYSDYIEFGMPGPFPPFPAPGTPPRQHYIVSNSASGIRFNGLTVYPVFGADVPNRFWHSNVVATLLTPTPVKAIHPCLSCGGLLGEHFQSELPGAISVIIHQQYLGESPVHGVWQRRHPMHRGPRGRRPTAPLLSRPAGPLRGARFASIV